MPYPRHGVRLAAASLVLLAACHPSPSEVTVIPVPESADSPDRTCRLERGPQEPSHAFARRCAESFIRANGYTSAQPADEVTPLAAESYDHGTREDVLRFRHNQLQLPAEYAECRNGRCTVWFRYNVPSATCRRRLVMMSTTFTGMHLQHQDSVMPVELGLFNGNRDYEMCQYGR